ncbi:hypothetical protein BLA29_006889 [Euroglyphus maynei]|uniref:Uncharacterized protein n=1 Tax=Euroglyphus maynei TaxID=6958 RepID=A0A1Y3AXF1_EURMA|nr:hypothetical protein BLA29_006889 [Euroglyphus maynei]
MAVNFVLSKTYRKFFVFRFLFSLQEELVNFIIEIFIMTLKRQQMFQQKKPDISKMDAQNV